MRKVWNEFIEKVHQEKGISLKNFLENFDFDLQGENITYFYNGGGVNEMFAKQIKEELVLFLREKLKNSFIQFEFKIDPSKAKILKDNLSKNAFTELAEKYPILNELKEKFALD